MSHKYLVLPHRPVAAVAMGILLMGLCMGLQHLSSAAAWIGQKPVRFEQVAPLTWRASLALLPPGSYVFEAGRPRGLCTATLGTDTLASTASIVSGLRSNLSFSGEFSLPHGTVRDITITCQEEAGFGPSLMHRPIITSHDAGAAIGGMRLATELLLGPISSLILAIIVAVTSGGQWVEFTDQRAPNRNAYRSQSVNQLADHRWRLYAFAAVSFAYALSLAYFPRLFIPGLPASALHVLLKAAHQAAFVAVCAPFQRGRIIATLMAVGLGIGGAAVTWLSPANLETYYNHAYFLIPASTLLVAVGLLRSEPKRDAHVILRVAAVAVLVSQISDTLVIWVNVGVYSAPALLAMMCATCALLAIREGHRRQRIERAIEEMTLIVTSGRSIPEIVRELADRARGFVHFERLSVYIDGYVVGLHDRPKEIFHRLAEFGYRKDTNPDDVITFAEQRGLKMLAAITLETPQLGIGEVDRAYYVNVGLSGHACLNFSDGVPMPSYIAYESHEILSRMARVFETLADRFVEYGFRTGIALESLRSRFGDGEKCLALGAIFADVNDYATLTSRFGDRYAAFISQVYLPAICRKVRPWAVREFSRGDELYLVSIPDLIQGDLEPAAACYRAILEIHDFVVHDGASLCLQQGYPPATVSIGCNFAIAKVVCDEMQVRTSGDMINQASRLKDAAGKSTTLIHHDMVRALEACGIQIDGEDLTILTKKSLVRARRHQREAERFNGRRQA